MLTLTPVSLAEANAFVAQHHRHHKPVTGHKFSIGCTAEGRLVGVAIVGRPVSRYLDNGLTLEVNRLCTDGTKNACNLSFSVSSGSDDVTARFNGAAYDKETTSCKEGKIGEGQNKLEIKSDNGTVVVK